MVNLTWYTWTFFLLSQEDFSYLKKKLLQDLVNTCLHFVNKWDHFCTLQDSGKILVHIHDNHLDY
jgi:hypothetical protein